jgi:uncharacterized protein YlzI (FlbEa/FlbD family)
MLSGKRHIIREEVDTILGMIDAYRRRISPGILQE